MHTSQSTELTVQYVRRLSFLLSGGRTRTSEFSSHWWTQKTNKPALRYEVAMTIQTANVVRAHGPFPAGVPDLTSFRRVLRVQLVRVDVFAITDDVFCDARCYRPPGKESAYHHHSALLRARN